MGAPNKANLQRRACIAAACLWLWTAGEADAREAGQPPDGSFVRITVTGGVSPYRKVAWDVTWRGRTAVVTLIKETLCHKGQRQSLKLLDFAAARDLFEQLSDEGIWELKKPSDASTGGIQTGTPPSKGFLYEFWIAWGKRMLRFHADQEMLLSDPALVKALGAVRDGVGSRVDPLPIQDLYHEPSRMGFVQITATEEAVAVLDGWQKVGLPVHSLEVVEGEHKVLVRGVTGRTSEFSLRVVAGMTNQIHVVLK